MTEDKSTVFVEDLLKPRYKVIAIYPFNDHFMLNEIIELNEFDSRSHLSLQEYFVMQKPLSKAGHKHTISMHESTFNMYPHLFKKLFWWEERKIEDMPEYLKTKSGKIIKVEEHFVGLNNNHVQWDNGRGWYSYALSTVSTESEYNQYINQKANT